MNPLHFSSSFTSEKPFNAKDVAVIVGGGIVLSAMAVPLWIGVSAAAWYGFTR
jgi:hypothetical protein